MRQRIMIGVLVILLAVTGYVLYRDTMGEEEPATSLASESVGTVRVTLDDEDLAKLQSLNPKLTLRASDGGQTPVLLWKVAKGEVVMQQFANLQPALYTALIADFGGGQVETLPIDVDLRIRP